MHETQRTANLLGATALALTDLTLGDVTTAAGLSASGAAALVTLSANPGVSVTELGRRVGLTQSAAARMVDSLEADGLVERRSTPVSRKLSAVHPTPAGQRSTQRLLAARANPLADVVASLDAEDQRALAGVLPKVLSRLYERIGDAQYMCRLCDRTCCKAGAACPVGEAERQQHEISG
ncbi:DNA-binding MarR family transcriptional regulator [Lipingzhangella halophila]|uniref:DNA-binding MarR family transcriptional regulator n=1 Tax=Lipingzhangella halophila TaxID=1783352 RepID=A0A7W7RGP7_9ACTN|nr:MarR family transcriptional regulator [Lipingzhangella halophila]MBB4931671.1 DNA-binding MarR family transcriptional regulator [Lipingzhangella halophila]